MGGGASAASPRPQPGAGPEQPAPGPGQAAPAAQQPAAAPAVRKAITDDYETLPEVTAALRRAGLESSNLIVFTDWTKSNTWTGAQSFGGRCLHDISGPTNPYEEALTIVARTLPGFDDDNQIPAYGFGDATTSDEGVFSLLPGDQPCDGLTSLVEHYRALVPAVNLAGPTSFAPAIRKAIQITAETGKYHICLIIADGQVTRSVDVPAGSWSPQEQDTVDAIVEASHWPISIVMVGVGDGPWDTMQHFDDNLPARQFDNFQVAVLSSPAIAQAQHREAAAALAMLMEVPEQYTTIARLGLLGKRGFATPVRTLDPPRPGGSSSRRASSAASVSEPPPVDVAGWACPLCSFVGGAADNACAMCGAARPANAVSGFACQACGQFVADAAAATCHHCGQPRDALPVADPLPSAPAAPTPPQRSASGAQARAELEARIEEERCVVCLVADRDTAFQCGHRTCGGCAEALNECPFCRAPVMTRIRLY